MTTCNTCQWWMRALGCILVCLSMVRILPATAQPVAADTVSAPVSQFNRADLTAALKDKFPITNPDKLSMWIRIYYITQLYDQNPAMDPTVANKDLALYLNQNANLSHIISSDWSKNDAWAGLIKLGVDGVAKLADAEDSSVLPLIPKLYDLGKAYYKDYSDVDDELAVDKFKQGWYEKINGSEDVIVNQLVNQCAANSQCYAALNPTIRSQLGVDLRDINSSNEIEFPEETITAVADPMLKAVWQMVQHIQVEQGQVQVSISDLQGQVTTIQTDIESMHAEDISMLEKIDAQQQNLLAYDRSQAAAQAVQRQAQQEAQTHQIRLEAAQSLLKVVTTLISFGNPDLGNKVFAVGNAAIQIEEAINKYGEAASSLGDILSGAAASTASASVLGPFAAIALGSNIVMAGISVLQAFGPHQPTTNELIIQGIQDIEQQIGDLQHDMNARFNHINQSLQTIYSTMTQDFAGLARMDTNILNNIQQVEAQLLDVQRSLDRIEANLYGTEWAAAWRQLTNTINQGIDYKDRVGPMSADTYNNIQSTLYTWAVDNSRDQLEAGNPPSRSIAPQDISRELSAWPLWANVNYVANVLQYTVGITPSLRGNNGEVLPNGLTWATSAEAYASIEDDWPQYASKMSWRSRTNDITQQGSGLEDALNRITDIGTPGHPQANRQLFAGLKGYYDSQIQSLLGAIKAEEDRYTAQQINDDWKRPGVLDPWGGPDQPTTWRTRANNPVPMECTGAVTGPCGNWCMPTIADSLSYPSFYRLADYMSPYTGDTQPQLTGTCRIDSDSWDDNRGVTHWWHWVGKVEVEYHGQELVSHCWDEPLSQYSDPGPGYDCTKGNPSQLNQQVHDAVQNALTRLQGDVYADIVNEMRSAGTEMTGDLRAIQGAADLDRAVLQLGMPQAVSTDDQMDSLLAGDSAILDGQAIAGQYVQTYNTIQADLNSHTLFSGRNVRLDINDLASSRNAALAKRIGAYMDAIDAGKYEESQPLLDATLAHLRLTDLALSPAQPTVAVRNPNDPSHVGYDAASGHIQRGLFWSFWAQYNATLGHPLTEQFAENGNLEQIGENFALRQVANRLQPVPLGAQLSSKARGQHPGAFAGVAAVTCTGPSKQYVAATRHCVSAPFLSVYRQPGPARLLGAPISEAYVQAQDDPTACPQGNCTITVQWFQNGRLEMSPHGAVHLSSLGWMEIKRRNWVAWKL